MKIREVLTALERFAPLPLQEDYDNAGLQVGLTETEVSGALLCLDVTEAIVAEAVRKGCNLIVSHHPLIFHKLRRLTDEDYVQRTVREAIRHDIAIVSMHTNIDAAQGGVNFKIAQKLGLQHLHFLGKQQQVKVASIQSDKSSEAACEEIVHGGEGVIGQLSQACAADDFVLQLRQSFGVECVQCNQLLRRPICRVAVCGGAGSFLLSDAIAAGADAFVTGEMSYHEYFGHEQEIQICVLGHYQSEQYTIELFHEVIESRCPGVRCELTDINTNPIIYLS